MNVRLHVTCARYFNDIYVFICSYPFSNFINPHSEALIIVSIRDTFHSCVSLLPAHLNLTKFFNAGMSVGEESSNWHSKMESPCSSDHTDAKGTWLAGTVVTGFNSIAIRYDTIRYDTIRYDTIRYDTIRYDTIRYDTIRYDTIRYDTIRYDTIRYDTIRYDTIRYDTIRYDTIRYDTIRYDTITLFIHGISIR